MTLSPLQLAAVEHDAPNVCVVAGPGSGKTRVLIERFAWLVERRGVDPGRILAITFTEKAANEMKQRLAKRFAGSPRLRERVETAWLSTIDTFCARLLGEHAIEAGLPPDFSVLEPAQATRLQREAAEEALDELFAECPSDMRRLMEALDLSTQDDGRQPDLAQSLIETYEAIRLAGVRDLPPAQPQPDVFPEARALALAISGDSSLTGADLPALLEWIARFLELTPSLSREHFAIAGSMPAIQRLSRRSPAYPAASRLKKEVLPAVESQWVETWYASLPGLVRTALQQLEQGFEEKKQRLGAVDFTGLEEKAIELLETHTSLRHRIASRFEHILMDELQDTNRLQWRLVNLLRGKLYAVGDINQSIYGFRHADRTVFDEFRAEASTVDLAENYRSRKEILETVQRLLNDQPGIEPRCLEAKRETGLMPVQRLTGTGDQAENDEAAQVAAMIREWMDSSAHQCRDIAILVRTLNSTPPFERALDRLNIPFLLSGGRTFLEARETKDLMAFLAALVNPLDEIALITVLRSPLVGWSDEQIMRASHEGWQQEFEKLFDRIRRLAGFIPPDRLIAMALDECGYAAGLSARARANIDKLLAWLRREQDARPRPLAELLDDLEALRETRAEAEAPPPEAVEAVRIMSIHAAKGLEFSVVFLSALHRGPDRRTPVILFSREQGLGMKWRNPAAGKGAPDAVHRVLSARRKASDEEEENRLLYVAMTRAEDRLILSYAERKQESSWVKLANLVEQCSPVDRSGQLSDFGHSRTGLRPVRIETILDKPTVSAQYDSSASVTSIALFDACPRKYYLSRYLNLDPEPTAPGTGAVELGREVHRALAGETVDSSEALALAERFRESDVGRRDARAQRSEREFDFQLAIEDIVLHGQIDLWFEESGELVVVDYKTDRDAAGLDNYAVQLRLYAIALELYAGRRADRAVLFYLRSSRAHEISLTPPDIEAVHASVRAFRGAQDSLEFPMHVGEHCRRCSFWKVQCEGL